MIRWTSAAMYSSYSETTSVPTTLTSMLRTILRDRASSLRWTASAIIRSRRNEMRSSMPSVLSSIARSVSTSILFTSLRPLTGASSGGRTRTPWAGGAGSACCVNWMASTSSGSGVHMPVSTSHTSMTSPVTSGARMAAGTTPASVSTCTRPSASTSRASSGPAIMPCDMPVSVRHTSNPRGDTAELMPRSCGVCPTTIRLAPSA
mmetsp:Transcript_20447/g.41431  ORF Transcript_20447/g.41431 Transcript_20447/m.41431 type:complete len:205 (+) Transcript_20447:129-743(+)